MSRRLLFPLGFILTLALIVLAPAAALTTSDTSSYLDFAPYRTAGYPIFLDLAGAAAINIQVVIFGLASLILARSILEVAGEKWAIASLIALFANPELNRLHWSLLTESLFTSILLCLLATLIIFVSRKEIRWLILASFLAGTAATIRPNAAPLVAAPILAIVLVRGNAFPIGRKAAVIGVALILWLCPIVAERGYARSVHGSQLTSLAPRHLFAKAALIDAPMMVRADLSATERRLADALESDYAPVRALLRDAEGNLAHQSLLQDYEVCIQWSCGSAFGLNTGDPALQDALERVATRRILLAPLSFAKLSMEEYRGLWLLGARTNPLFANDFDRYIAGRRPLPFDQQVSESGLTQPTKARRIALIVTPAYLALGVIMLGLLLWSTWRIVRCRDDRSLYVFLPVSTAQISLVFTALAGVGYGRYTVAVWPAVVASVALFLANLPVFTRRKSITEGEGRG